ncbi:hypothetical protein QBC35DRAFT_379229 [Podospora australis]|uniref:DUF3984 domain-containing protein n=1 Tax=Podospora australis TaxID=1536484 RepID=A0AAN6WWW7_9PEZI|nr:hypothetical protein QBC35DRAFT_379229 [Podospora australis]
MDVAYNQHSIRRKSRSSGNLTHLSLAPLTSKLPLRDSSSSDEVDLSESPTRITSYSYLQGKSAPTTPRLLSRSPGGGPRNRDRGSSAQRAGATAKLPKSKSAVHLSRQSHGTRHATSPTSARRSGHHHHGGLTKNERSDSDWLLRCGALISTETRESKGQAWLISRASSTSLSGVRDAEDEAFEAELAREREEFNGYHSLTHSRHASRRGSRRNSLHNLGEEDGLSSPAYSRYGSRSHSRSAITPRSAVFVEDYFNSNGATPTGGITKEPADMEEIAGPDFVNLDEDLEAAGDEDLNTFGADDEAYVRKLVKGGNGGVGSWFGNVLGVKLFAVEEEDQEESEDDEDEDNDTAESSSDVESAMRERRVSSLRKLESAHMAAIDTSIPPPKPDEGGWSDAAWLLTLASKVLL